MGVIIDIPNNVSTVAIPANWLRFVTYTDNNGNEYLAMRKLRIKIPYEDAIINIIPEGVFRINKNENIKIGYATIYQGQQFGGYFVFERKNGEYWIVSRKEPQAYMTILWNDFDGQCNEFKYNVYNAISYETSCRTRQDPSLSTGYASTFTIYLLLPTESDATVEVEPPDEHYKRVYTLSWTKEDVKVTQSVSLPQGIL